MSKSCYLKQGSSFIPSNEDQLNIHIHLPPGKYVIKEDPRTEELYFEQLESEYKFQKLYGKTERYVSRIIRTFQERSVSTGVGCVGEKGSGKTLLARLLSQRCLELGIPTIIINEPLVGEKFNKIIQDLTQPVMVLFDEFEKVYDKDEQEQVLTLLDGVFPSKKLFVITSNDRNKMDAHLSNRPGRVYYMLDFAGLDEDEVREYCTENLQNKSHVEEIVKVSKLYGCYNFDMMKAMVEEMNRYGEDVHQVMEMLNTRPSSDTSGRYEATLRLGNKMVETLWPSTIMVNPMSMSIIKVSYSDDKLGEPWEDDNEQTFFQADLVDVDIKNGLFKYVNSKGAELTYTRIDAKNGDFKSLISKISLS